MEYINVAQDEQHEQDIKSTVTIKLKKGEWEIEIRCKEDKVKEVVENVLSSIKDKEDVKDVKEEVKKVDTKKNITCKGLIEKLWHEGWFIDERNLSEVHEELSRRGYNYDKTAVSHALTDLVREGILTRVGSVRIYRYVQKRPPTI